MQDTSDWWFFTFYLAIKFSKKHIELFWHDNVKYASFKGIFHSKMYLSIHLKACYQQLSGYQHSNKRISYSFAFKTDGSDLYFSGKNY